MNTSLYLKIGLDDNQYKGCTTSLQKFYSCPDITVKAIVFWLKLIWSGEVKLITYPRGPDGEYNSTLWDDLQDGVLDILAGERVLNKDDYPPKYTVISVGEFKRFSFYAKLPSLSENGIKFLFHPFQTSVWVAIVMILALLTFFSIIFYKYKPNFIRKLKGQNTFILRIVSVLVAFLLCLYASRLKALLNTPHSSIPFENLQELMKKIENGQTEIYLEDCCSTRWRLLMEDNYTKPEVFRELQQTLNKTNSLKIVQNVEKICELISQNSNLLYFAYDSLINLHCPEFCFWKYEVTELPESASFVPMYRNSKFVRNATLFSSAVLNVKTIETKKVKLFRRCSRVVEFNEKSNYIGAKSLKILFCLYIICLFITIIIFVAEVIITRFSLCDSAICL